MKVEELLDKIRHGEPVVGASFAGQDLGGIDLSGARLERVDLSRANLRGASLECLVCGEFVQHRLGVIGCPECGMAFGEGGQARLQLDVQAG